MIIFQEKNYYFIYRILPHYIEYLPSISQLALSISAFYQRIVSHKRLPIVTWNKITTGELKIRYSEKPAKIILWFAENPISQDFRYSCAIHYHPTDLRIDEHETKLIIPSTKQG